MPPQVALSQPPDASCAAVNPAARKAAFCCAQVVCPVAQVPSRGLTPGAVPLDADTCALVCCVVAVGAPAVDCTPAVPEQATTSKATPATERTFDLNGCLLSPIHSLELASMFTPVVAGRRSNAPPTSRREWHYRPGTRAPAPWHRPGATSSGGTRVPGKRG